MRFYEAELDYTEILKAVLVRKQDSSEFPNDERFKNAIRTKNFYKMQRNPRSFIFERLENRYNRERINVFEGIEQEKGGFSIEHIMPQNLTAEWRNHLGSEWKETHERYLNSIGNLTLTAYNSKLSNKIFDEKKEHFKQSHFQLNIELLEEDYWNEQSIAKREEMLIKRFIEVFPYPESNFKLQSTVADLEVFDEESSYTSRKLIGYKFLNEDYKSVKSWKDMFVDVITHIYYHVDYAPIINLANQKTINFITEKREGYTMIDEGIYLFTSNSTWTKLNIFKKVCEMYDSFETWNLELRFSNEATE